MTQKQADRHSDGDTANEDVEAIPASQEHRETRATDVDTMLDEIDSVLEENAQEFVQAYVQIGGQ